MKWFTTTRIRPEHTKIKISQVYCWIYTRDKKIVLVSKNNEKWQFPGGHPEEKENLTTSLIREVFEETGLNLNNYSTSIKMLGYYLLKEFNSRRTELEEKLQTRFFVILDEVSSKISLRPNEKDINQPESEKIKFVKAVDIEEAYQLVPWLGKTEELQAFLSRTND